MKMYLSSGQWDMLGSLLVSFGVRRLIKRVLDSSSVMFEYVAWSCCRHRGTVSGAKVRSQRGHWIWVFDAMVGAIWLFCAWSLPLDILLNDVSQFELSFQLLNTLFFFFLRRISLELTSAASPPLFAEDDWPWANIHAYLPLFYMWDPCHSMAGWVCIGLCPGSEPVNPVLPKWCVRT